MSRSIRAQDVLVTVNLNLCVGVGMCVQLAPEGFRLNAVGQSEFRPDGAWTIEDLTEAVESCPMSAITLTIRAEGKN